MVNVFDTLRRVRAIAMIRHWAAISVMSIEMVVHVAAKMSRTVKPRARTNEEATVKPLRAVVAVRSAGIRSVVVVAIRARGLVIESIVGHIVCVGSRREEYSGN
jgi:ATP/maltotriose-dependent transcriptional regulator MalT